MSARLSDEMHALKGTRATRATAETESAFFTGRPKCPPEFTEIEKKKWKEVVRLFAARRVLTKADSEIIALYVTTYFRHQALLLELKEHGELVEETDRHGNTRRVANPAGKAATACESQLRQILKEFGGTPLTREKSKPAKQPVRAESYEPGTVGWYLQQQAREEKLRQESEAQPAPVSEQIGDSDVDYTD